MPRSAMKGLLRHMTTVIAAAGIAGLAETAHGFDLQGHRGARGLMPENSLPGFAKALSIGVNTLELDLGATRDGVIVVMHNPEIAPETTRDGEGNWLDADGPALRSLTLTQLKTFDIGRLKPGTRYQRRFSGQDSVDGARVPTLAEVFDLVRRSGNTTVRFNIETKIRPAEPDLYLEPRAFIDGLLSVAREAGVVDRITIQSFDWRTLREAQKIAPDVPTSYLTVQQNWLNNIKPGEPGASPWTAGFDIDAYGGSLPDMIKSAGGHIWSSYHREITPEAVARAHELGLQVKVWTVNDAKRMDELIDLGVDGIITDYPDRLRAVMESRGIPVPKPTPVMP